MKDDWGPITNRGIGINLNTIGFDRKSCLKTWHKSRLSEKSKELNPIEWTKLMNNYKNMAEEIVLNEYIFV